VSLGVDIQAVDKAFGDNIVYRGLNLHVERGETLTVLGPSGSGKSVLLKLMVGLLGPDAGSILIGGVDIAPLSERALRDVRTHIGFVFQGAALFDSLTVAENVAYGLREQVGISDEFIEARVSECLGQVGLPGLEDLMPAELSGGMKKRVGLARALAPGPELILYDEPTTGLDPANARRINELIVALQAQLSVTSVVITHDLDGALAVSDRIGLLEDHRIDLIVDADEVRRSPPPPLQTFMRGEF
jgi:phospholipid/cholesterol/gamma-HCH transport system ATP-binding protein